MKLRKMLYSACRAATGVLLVNLLGFVQKKNKCCIHEVQNFYLFQRWNGTYDTYDVIEWLHNMVLSFAWLFFCEFV